MAANTPARFTVQRTGGNGGAASLPPAHSHLQQWLSTRQHYRAVEICRRCSPRAAVNFDVPPPPIDGDLQDMMVEAGAVLSPEGIAMSFTADDSISVDQPPPAMVMDMTHFGRLRVTGDDRLRFLHNQSTADFTSLKPGQGTDTVFVSPTARTIELATAWVMDTAVILSVSPDQAQPLVKFLDKYIFFADKVDVSDISSTTCQLALMGTDYQRILSQMGLEEAGQLLEGHTKHFSLLGEPITVAGGTPLCLPGVTFLSSPAVAGTLWSSLATAGCTPIGAEAWERLRIKQGRPAVGKELTDQFNVLECGMHKTISLTKGCYIGQETVARLITYDGVKQHLRGLESSDPLCEGNALIFEGKKVGKVTSVCQLSPSRWLGLGYVKRGIPESSITIEGSSTLVTICHLPFTRMPHNFLPQTTSSVPAK